MGGSVAMTMELRMRERECLVLGAIHVYRPLVRKVSSHMLLMCAFMCSSRGPHLIDAGDYHVTLSLRSHATAR